MSQTIVHDISETARWAAVFRARETERPDALFRDPFAAKLAGTRGFAIADALSQESHSVSWVVRTYLFDRFIAQEIKAGTDFVVNLAAGLDTRPYRMPLPSSCKWIEVDLPEILTYKEAILANEKPVCDLQRIPMDLLNCDARRKLFADFGRQAKRILVITEGLLVYLSSAEVATLARDLSTRAHFQRWVLEIVSRGVLETMERTAGTQLNPAGAYFKFAPVEGPQFFTPYGWEPIEVRGVLRTAISLNRTPIDPQVHELIPDLPMDTDGSAPWVGVCLFKKAG